jgi:hypothetical protein
VGAAQAPGRFGAGGIHGGSRASASERLYAGLLRLYPAAFRARYGEEMVVLFGDQLRDARAGRGPGSVVAIWIRSLFDLAASAVGEHLRRDRTVAQSLATFEPSRSMRLLGLFGLVGAGLLLWAFISIKPFEDPALNRIRLVTFALAGAAVSLAFYRQQALAAPALARLTTAAVVIAGVWYAGWVILSAGVDRPFVGTFGFVYLLANIALWVSPAIWALGMLHTGAAWQGMPRRLEIVTKIALWILVGSIVGWLGDDRLGLVDSLWGELWQAVAIAGVNMNGLGWGVLGAVLLVGGRSRPPGRA